MKDSIKALVLIFMIANAFSADLTINKKFKLGLKTQKAQKSKSKEKAGLKMIRSSRYSSKTQDPATGVSIAVYLITKVIDGITKYFNDKAQEMENLVKDLKNKNLQTLATFRETVQEMKTSLCNSIRNSNFFFFDFLTYFLIDLYFKRKQTLSTLQMEMMKKLKRKNSIQFSFRSFEAGNKQVSLIKEAEKLKTKQLNKIQLKDPRNGNKAKKIQHVQNLSQNSQEKSDAEKLAPYDNLSQSIFAVKQSLKSFQNSICNFENDIVDENNFVRARSEGIAISLAEDPEGNFFFISKIVLDFGSMLSDIASYAAKENKADFKSKDLSGTLNADNSDKSSTYQEYKNRMERLSGLGVKNADGDVVVKAESFFSNAKGMAANSFLDDPYGFFKEQWGNIVKFFESVKKLGNLTVDKLKQKSKGDVNKQYLEAFRDLAISLLNLAVTIYMLKGFYDTIQALKGKGDFWSGFGNAYVSNSNTQKMAYDTNKIPLQIPQLVSAVFDYIMVRYDNIEKYHSGDSIKKAIAGSKIWIAKKKMLIQIAKTIFLLMLYCLGPYLMVGMVRLLKGLTVALMKSGWSATQSATAAADMCVNIVFVLKIFISLLQLALAILRYIKAKRIARDVRNDFYGEKRLRDNILEQLKIQIVYVTFKYNTVMLQSFQDILRFYETVVNFEEVKKVPLKIDSDQTTNMTKSVKEEIDNQTKNLLNKTDQKCTIPSRYHNLDTTSFFIKLCQENETYCTRHLTPSILLSAYHLPEKDVETIFKISYNDLVAGPISDIYVATPGSTLLSEPYLEQGNWKFYRKSIPDKANEEKGEDVGETFAILYRRCGNALNYLEDVNYFTVNIPSDVYKIFANRKEIVDKISAQSDTKNRGFIVNSYFSTETPAPSPTGVKRKMVYFTLNTSEGIEKLRGDDKNTCEESRVASDPTTTQRSLIFSLDNFAEKKVYDFATMTWEDFKCGGSGDYSTCSYLFSFLDGSTPPNGSKTFSKVIEYYQNPCHKVLGADKKKSAEEKKVVLAKLDSSRSFIYARANHETKTHVNLYDQRFYGRSKSCYGNFDRLDKAILKIDQSFVNINAAQYLESQTECYETKKQLSINSKMSEAEFIFSAQVNLLKTRVSIIKSEVCNAYVLFQPPKPIGNDSVCTKAQETEFQELGIFFCDKDNKKFHFFQTLQAQYGVVPAKGKIYNYIETDENNTESHLELTDEKPIDGNICDSTPLFGKQKFYFYSFEHKILPNPSLFWNLKGTLNNPRGEYNALLMRHNTQFNQDADNETNDIPSLSDLDETLSQGSISVLIGEDSIFGRDGGKFHLVVPFSREITLPAQNGSGSKKVISDLVFRIDRKLQILLGRHKNKIDKGKTEVDINRCKIKGNIFKVMLSDEIDPDADEKIDYKEMCDPRPSETEQAKKSDLTPAQTQALALETNSDSKDNINVQSTMNSVQDQMVLNEKADTNVEGFQGGNKPKFVLNPPLIEFAKPYKYMYVEFRLFETVHWYEILTANKMDYMNLSGLEFLLDKCFILYWPRFKPTYKDLETDVVQPEPTFNFYVPFNYSGKWSIVSRYWVKYDFFYRNEKLEIDCAEEVKTIDQRKRLFMRIHKNVK